MQRVKSMTVLRLCLRFIMNFTSNSMIQSRHCNWWWRTLWPNSRHWPALTQNFVSLHLIQLTVVMPCWK